MEEMPLARAMEAAYRTTGKPVRVTMTADGDWEIEAFTSGEARDDDPERHVGYCPFGQDVSQMVVDVAVCAAVDLRDGGS